jgi:hypothetical protein
MVAVVGCSLAVVGCAVGRLWPIGGKTPLFRGDPHSFTHVNFVGMYVGIGSIQYQRVVSCVNAEDTLGVGEVPPCFALVEHFGGFFVGVHTPALCGPEPTAVGRAAGGVARCRCTGGIFWLEV